MILDNEFYYLVKVQVSEESQELAETAEFGREEHSEDIGANVELSVRDNVDLESIVDNIDVLPLDVHANDVVEALFLLTHKTMIEEWTGDPRIMQFAVHLDTLRQLYFALAHP